jgi:hypothetical protein
MKKSIYGLFVLSGLLMADFVRDDDKEVVNDTTTCLMWQDDNASETVIKTWQEAIDYCEDISFAGYEDWRLPNFNELYSIGDRSKYNPAIKDAFKNIASRTYLSSTAFVVDGTYWSSTTFVDDANNAWIVSADYGRSNSYAKTNYGFVRCVRDRQ